VAGGGGYWHLHYVSKALGSPIQLPYQVPDDPSVQLESYCDNRQGYLTLDLIADRLVGTYTPVPRLHESWTQRLNPLDTFTLDFREHRLVCGGNGCERDVRGARRGAIMIQLTDQSLKTWVQSVVVAVEVRLLAPGATHQGSGVGLYLMDLVDSPPPRQNGRTPLHFGLRYLVTTWADDPEEEHPCWASWPSPRWTTPTSRSS
jgi:hypothetical protein